MAVPFGPTLFKLSPVSYTFEVESLMGSIMRARFVALSGSLLVAFTVMEESIVIGETHASSLLKQATPIVTASAPIPRRNPAVPESMLRAKDLFAAKPLPSVGKAMAIGYYPRGC